MASPSRETLAQADRLLRAFDRKNPDGSYVFPDGDVRAFLPLVILGLGESLPSPWPEPLQKVMDEFAETLGIAPDATPAQVQDAVDGFYAAHPVNPALLKAFQEAVHEELSSGTMPAARAEAAKKLIGAAGSNVPLSTSGAAPAGAVKAAAWRTGGKVELPRRPSKPNP